MSWMIQGSLHLSESLLISLKACSTKLKWSLTFSQQPHPFAPILTWLARLLPCIHVHVCGPDVSLHAPRPAQSQRMSSSVTKDVPLGSQPDPSAVVIKQLLDRKWTNVTYLQSVFTHTQIACSLSFTHVQSANTPNCGWVVLKLHTWLQGEKAVEDIRLGQPCAHDILQCLPLRCPGVKSSL